MHKIYNHLILGGTFDHFHKGHELFVATALKQGKKITIGLTTEKLYEHKLLSSQIETYEARKSNIIDFIKSKQTVINNITVIPLTNVYGNGFTDKTVDGLVVTQDTKKGGILINKKRKEIGMKPLDIIVVPMVKGDDGETISSERIRYGDIDRQGKNYYKWLVDRAPLLLPTSLRPQMREPLGDLIQGSYDKKHLVVKQILNTIKISKPPMVFSIGDIISESLWEVGYQPSVSVIDLRTRRKALEAVASSKYKVASMKKYHNPAGTITKSVISQVKVLRDLWFERQKPQQLIIQGEEDMAALPAIMFAPLRSIVLYGQYDLGVVLVKVTEEKKEEVWQALQKFDYQG